MEHQLDIEDLSVILDSASSSVFSVLSKTAWLHPFTPSLSYLWPGGYIGSLPYRELPKLIICWQRIHRLGCYGFIAFIN